jgi:dynein heavy chain
LHLIEINPKSISLNNLFGYTNPLTNEWNEGIVSNEVISVISEKMENAVWMVFDGPAE